MNSFAAFVHDAGTRLHSAVTVLRPLVAGLFGTIGNIVGNRPEPARQVVVYTVVLALITWAAFKITKKLVSK